MQAKSCQFMPPFCPATPSTSPPGNKVSFPAKTSRAISITAPSDLVIAPDVLDDSVAAFWDYQFLFVSQRSETAEPVTLRAVDCCLPPDFPSGTYYLTGPGMFTDDHGSTVHPLDGHGYLRSFTVDAAKGEIKFMARYVETEAHTEERDSVTGAWRFTHRGPFSVLKSGKMVGNTKVMKNVANTSVLRWGGRLFCLWEGGDPYEIESRSLDTVGKFEAITTVHRSRPLGEGFEGAVWNLAASVLKPILYGVFKMPPRRLLSHYKIDARRDRLLILSCNAEDMLLPRSNFTFYEFDSNFKLLQSREFNVPDHLMIHDWAFTDSYYILFGNRIKLDAIGSMAAVCGLSPMISALSVNPSKPTSPVYLLPRFSSESTKNTEIDWRVPIEAPSQMWVLHVGNAFEERGDNGNTEIQIQATCCSYSWFNFQKMFGYDWQTGKLDPSTMNVKEGEDKLLPHLVKVSITLGANGKFENCSVKPLNQWSKASDFPVNQGYSGSRNTYIYAATSSGSRQALPHFPFDTVVKLNTSNKSIQTWSAGRRRFIGEPVFVPKGSQEDDGYILVVEYAVSRQRCYLVILDAKRIGGVDALVARFEVPKHLNFPLGFHGLWAPDGPTLDN
ncbi:carotenoid cleavage dioxygenase 7, chloroplastic [Diospyros lotus]|uniref:carotenoid cleavage dioxygenase 7, chloroplastic n=1 Tax=Diospyros lotus TaxID=55363 RepID=UPI002258A055|nr:carotenoid cleavage dioxygenase 7, chloroplastic [Diospyros lotus]